MATRIEVPYGLQVSDDCLHLEENPEEMRVLKIAMEIIVDDGTLSEAVEALNRKGLRNRQGQPWTQTTVFNLMPRMVEMGPRIFAGDDWIDRRRRLMTA